MTTRPLGRGPAPRASFDILSAVAGIYPGEPTAPGVALGASEPVRRSWSQELADRREAARAVRWALADPTPVAAAGRSVTSLRTAAAPGSRAPRPAAAPPDAMRATDSQRQSRFATFADRDSLLRYLDARAARVPPKA